MGSYTFKWEHPANEVFVTGTFDDWSKTVKLEKTADGVFEKEVPLSASEKIYYKFVVDGNWVVNDSAPKEPDNSNNVNNYITASDLKTTPAAQTHILSNVTPESTTAELAGQVPKELDQLKDAATSKEEDASSPTSLPGAFPETPANELQSPPLQNKEEEQTFGVKPLPAAAGAANPIHLAPGEKVPDPSTFTTNTVDSNVKTDPASYEKSDALPPKLDVPITPEADREANGGMFGLPPVSGTMIPESSLPIGGSSGTEQDPGVTIQSAAPQSTTAELASQVPKEPRAEVPDIVTESQKEADFGPEATSSPDVVQEKAQVEQELLSEVPKAPAVDDLTAGKVAQKASEGAAVAGTVAANAAITAKDKLVVATAGEGATTTDAANVVKNKVVEAATGAANTITDTAYAGKDKLVGATDVKEDATLTKDKAVETTYATGNTVTDTAYAAKDKVVETIGAAASTVTDTAYAASDRIAETTGLGTNSGISPEVQKSIDAMNSGSSGVPATVTESIQQAHVSPEAAANPEAVSEKQQMESELVAEVKKSSGSDEAAPATQVPAPVTESIENAHKSPEAAANPEVVAEKKKVESELLKEVKPVDSSGEPAPTVTATQSATAPGDGLSPTSLTDSKPLKSSSEQLDVPPLDTAPTAISVPPTERKGLNQPTDAPAQSVATETGQLAAMETRDSRDVSPMSKTPTAPMTTEPTVTTGVKTASIENPPTEQKSVAAGPSTPKKVTTDAASGTPASTKTGETESEAGDKKKKRRSFFGKLKDVVKSHKH